MDKCYGWVNFMVYRLYLTDDVLKKRQKETKATFYSLQRNGDNVSSIWTILSHFSHSAWGDNIIISSIGF